MFIIFIMTSILTIIIIMIIVVILSAHMPIFVGWTQTQQVNIQDIDPSRDPIPTRTAIISFQTDENQTQMPGCV